jgi:CRP-like cAMP-binding protein
VVILQDILVKIVAKSPMFSGISIDTLTIMFAYLSPKLLHCSANSYIVEQNEKIAGLGLLIHGKASIIKENVTGKSMLIKKIKNGESFGIRAVFSQQNDWPVSVVAKTDCTVMFLPREKIAGKCKNTFLGREQVLQNMLLLVSQNNCLLHRKLEYIALKNLRKKICMYFLEQYEASGEKTFTLPLNRNELADFLYVSRPALSREIGRMRDEEIIDFFSTSITLRNVDVLKQILEYPD